ncbi:hypothetical protein GGI00_002245 [Coemansia sp. RSA 2681]|nr:hypothetical protein GGI00_002245 [Coemansia sp. RSA 2681]
MNYLKRFDVPKRARTSKGHGADHECNDDSCSCCGDGPVQLDEQVLREPAPMLLAMALQEADKDTPDRPVVIKLFEAAVEKFGDEKSLDRAWTLLRFAEYAEYTEYADMAVSLTKELDVSDERARTLCELLEARAKILSACLEQSNWRDPAADDGDSDDDEALSKPITGEEKLVDGLTQMVAANFGSHSSDAYRDKLAFLFARRDAHPLTSRLLLALFDAAATIVYEREGWLAAGNPEKAVAAADDDGVRKTAHHAVLVWAMAAAECSVDCEAIEARLEPLIKYLDSKPSDAECCRLYAELLIVLCGCYEDEEKAIAAYELASSKLVLAHRLSPDNPEIKSQLADMGISLS